VGGSVHQGRADGVQHQWLDQYTRAVLIEFNVLNPNSKLFNQVIIAFEYTNDGGTLWKVSVEVVQLYRYAGSAGVVALLSEILCAIFVLVITVWEIIRVCRMRLRGSFPDQAEKNNRGAG